MGEQHLSSYLQVLFECNQENYIQTRLSTKSNESDAKHVMEAINYTRKVMVTHELALQRIQKRSAFLTNKYETFKVDFKNLTNVTDDLKIHTKHLLDKVIEGQRKQQELMKRTNYIVRQMKSCKNMSDAEMQFGNDLEKIKEKVYGFNNVIKIVNEKHAIIVKESCELQCFQEQKCKLLDSQLDVVRTSLNDMDEGIQQIFNDIININRAIDKDKQFFIETL